MIIYWDAFVALSRARSYSLRFGAKETQFIACDAIIFSEITSYANAIGLSDVEEKMRLVRIVQHIDAAYLNEANKGVK